MVEKQLKPGRLLKKHMIDQIAKRFKNAPSLFITDCGKLSNNQMEDLRKRLKKISNNYTIVKNSMCIKALEKIKLERITSFIKGTCGIGFGKSNPVLTSKTLVDFAKENEKFQLKAAYIDGKVFEEDAIKRLACVPPREVLLARLLFILNSPISGMAGVLSGIFRKSVYVLNAIKDQKQGGK